MLDNRKR